MTLWDFLAKVMENTSAVLQTVALFIIVAAAIVIIVGFARHGLVFFKYGFGDKPAYNPDAVLDKLVGIEGDISGIRSDLAGVHAEIAGVQTEIAGVQSKLVTKDDLAGIQGEINTLKSNHFAYLKNFLTELTGILVDRNIINNENKACLDNHLRSM